MRGDRERRMEEFTDWYYSPEDKRIPRSKLAIKLSVSDATLKNWGNQLESDNGDFSEAEITSFKRMLFRDAMGTNAKAKDKELAARMLGVLIERKEEKIAIVITGDEQFRRNKKVREYVEEYELGGGGVDEVRDERPVLLDEVRLHTEQEHGEDSEVGTVGVPSGLAETVQRIQRTNTVQG